ncbi:hypothetical protein D6783_02965 [Candidatus Woesearchaeota archaeon]|nr:MAG: hypothetical protein D6783_02965 [Candidatus Woesearchaeota archaeon]
MLRARLFKYFFSTQGFFWCFFLFFRFSFLFFFFLFFLLVSPFWPCESPQGNTENITENRKQKI